MTGYELEALEFVRENFKTGARRADVLTVLNRLIMGGRDWKTGRELVGLVCGCHVLLEIEPGDEVVIVPGDNCPQHPAPESV